MKTMTITITMPDQVELPFGDSEQEFARELRLAAAIHWYDRGLISQGKGAEIAGLTRSEFMFVIGRASELLGWFHKRTLPQFFVGKMLVIKDRHTALAGRHHATNLF